MVFCFLFLTELHNIHHYIVTLRTPKKAAINYRKLPSLNDRHTPVNKINLQIYCRILGRGAAMISFGGTFRRRV